MERDPLAAGSLPTWWLWPWLGHLKSGARSFLWFSHVSAGAMGLRTSFAAFPDCEWGPGLEVEPLEHEPVLIEDANAKGRGLVLLHYCANPRLHILYSLY